jgi:hypothetical protein
MSNALSAAQKSLYDAAQSGKSKDVICQELGLDSRTFDAQVTRIRKKGFSIDVAGCVPYSGSLASASKQAVQTGAKQIIDEAFEAGEATYDVEKAIQEAQDRGDVHGDMAQMHPMAIMGLTIQFMRLCGGRFHAHQIIEDVYGAVRSFAGDGPSPDDVVRTATEPFTTLGQENLDQLLGKVGDVKDDLEVLLGKLHPDTA